MLLHRSSPVQVKQSMWKCLSWTLRTSPEHILLQMWHRITGERGGEGRGGKGGGKGRKWELNPSMDNIHKYKLITNVSKWFCTFIRLCRSIISMYIHTYIYTYTVLPIRPHFHWQSLNTLHSHYTSAEHGCRVHTQGCTARKVLYIAWVSASVCTCLHLGAFGCFWVHLGAFGCIWVHLGDFGAICLQRSAWTGKVLSL